MRICREAKWRHSKLQRVQHQRYVQFFNAREACHLLLNPCSERNTIPQRGNEARQVQQRRNPMHAAKCLVQLLHLFRMWCGVVVFLSVSGFCAEKVSKVLCFLQHVCNVPWCFLSLIIFVVAGPTNAIFARLVTKIVAMGIKTLHLLTSAKTPWKPDGVSKPSFDAGYVRAITTGSVV